MRCLFERLRDSSIKRKLIHYLCSQSKDYVLSYPNPFTTLYITDTISVFGEIVISTGQYYINQTTISYKFATS